MKNKIRFILMVLIFIMLFMGIINGGLNDVLIKAKNICLECIGLGK